MDKILKLLATATIAIAAPVVAHSAEFRFVGTQVTMTGEIVDGDSARYSATVKDLLVRSIALDSKGGKIIEALDIGEKIRDKKVDTTVGPDGLCASACALVWAAGIHRSIADGGRVGFHAAYDQDHNPTSTGNAVIGAYLMKLGYDYPAVAYAVEAQPSGMNWLNPQEARTSGFTYEIKNIVEAKQLSNAKAVVGDTGATQKMGASMWDQLDGLLVDQYKQCWSYLGLDSATQYNPQVKVLYSKDGGLIGEPKLINPPSDPSMRTLAESALRAVQNCNPLRIPAQFAPYYEQWKRRVLNFDPIDTAGEPLHGCAKASAQVAEVFGSTKGFSCKE